MPRLLPKSLGWRITASVLVVTLGAILTIIATHSPWGWSLGRPLDQILRDNLLFQCLVLAGGAALVIAVLQGRLVRPLLQVLDLLRRGADAEAFYLLGRRPDELGKLAQAIGGMLTRIACTSQRLHQREQTLQSLYELAPAGLLALDMEGKIVEANLKAACIVGLDSDRQLVGRAIWDLVCRQDHPRLRHALRRLDFTPGTRCEVRLQSGTSTPDVAIECAAVRDELGTTLQVRLAMIDVSPLKQLQRRLADKSRLLDLIVEHMAEAILLVGPNGHIAAHNRQLTALLHRHRHGLVGHRYDAQSFWDDLGVLDHDPFVDRLRQIEADPLRPAQERFATASGTLLFHSIPVQDVAGMGRLWVIQEVSAQEQTQGLLQQQTRHLQALRRLTQRLYGAADPEQVLERSVRLVYEAFGIEAVGIALRRGEDGRRSHQLLHRGSGPCLLEPNRALVTTIERRLLPLVLANDGVIAWPDLPPELPWTRTFRQAGLTGLAAAPLRGSRDDLGILWIGRHGGEALANEQIHLLEALAPCLAGWLEVSLLRQQMQTLHVTDGLTGLPGQGQFNLMAEKIASHPGQSWSTLLVRVDHFDQIMHDLGVEQADLLLRNLAQLVQRCCRRSTFIARLHGPSFGLLCPHTSASEALVLAQRIRLAAAALLATPKGQQSPALCLSAALVCAPPDGHDAQQILSLAWSRLEQAKRLGGNTIVAGHQQPDRQAG